MPVTHVRNAINKICEAAGVKADELNNADAVEPVGVGHAEAVPTAPIQTTLCRPHAGTRQDFQPGFRTW
jgi:hypothetical protein